MGEPVVPTSPAIERPPASPDLLTAGRASAPAGGTVLRLGVAAVLLLAASFKTYELVTEPGLRVYPMSRWLQAAQVEYEFLLALWLLGGFWSKRCRSLSLVTFALFGCYSLYLAVSGAVSCGCFGRVHVNPWWSFALDVAVILALWRWRPSVVDVDPGPEVGAMLPRSLLASLVLAAGVGSLGLIALAVPGPPPAGTESPVDQALVILEPEKWVGKSLPILQFIDIGDRLSKGDWTLVFIHHDCPKCRVAIPDYEQLARDLSDEHRPERIAFIQVPPHGPVEHDPGAPCERGKLSDDREWFVETPTVVKLADSRVIAATTGE